MILHFNGAARSVTGSQYLMEVNGKTLLFECGLYQGDWDDSYQRNLHFQFDPSGIDAAVLSHAHIDHSGNFPNLLKQGYTGPIYATQVTCDLADLMLRDSGHIQEADAEYINKKRARHNLPPQEPLYTAVDAGLVKMQLKPLPYDQGFEIFPGITLTLVEAGHILGSASVVLDVKEAGSRYRVWFSGDIGRYEMPLLRDPVLPSKADTLVMESTYGDKNHDRPEAAFEEFRSVVQTTIRRGGKVIVPAFAVGRTQELVYELNKMMTAREIPKVPIFVDSPLAVGASEIFSKHSSFFDDETHEFTRTGHHPALAFEQLTYVKTVEESKALNHIDKPMIILAASGMANTGRIVHHIKNNIEDPRSTIVIVSWQAPGTLGRQLADRQKEFEIHGEHFHRKAEVATIGGFSAHADQKMLLTYAKASCDTLKKIFLVHGEEKPAETLLQKIRAEVRTPIEYPELYETVEIHGGDDHT
jgi:metallo-beta-lactamase family protein